MQPSLASNSWQSFCLSLVVQAQGTVLGSSMPFSAFLYEVSFYLQLMMICLLFNHCHSYRFLNKTFGDKYCVSLANSSILTIYFRVWPIESMQEVHTGTSYPLVAFLIAVHLKSSSRRNRKEMEHWKLSSYKIKEIFIDYVLNTIVIPCHHHGDTQSTRCKVSTFREFLSSHANGTQYSW